MPYQNISAEISDRDKREILDLVQQIESRLNFLINLTPEERQSIPKMGDKTIAFVQKALELAQQNPNLVPPYVNLDELRRDFELSIRLKDILNAVSRVYEKLSDTYIAAGSEAFTAALSFYKSAKAASKMNVAGTDIIVEELSKRFEKKLTSPENPEQG
ncbi:MAG: hypothetical protein NZM09_08245 [Ignavibacterium sp.]|nr:hypothetical protein [Ignavibacterium sp.]MDW8375672.1 hypothetical protein [Ignavibacteriales bacterium]